MGDMKGRRTGWVAIQIPCATVREVLRTWRICCGTHMAHREACYIEPQTWLMAGCWSCGHRADGWRISMGGRLWRLLPCHTMA